MTPTSIASENNLKARIVGNRTTATFALIGAMISMHYTYTSDGWHGFAFGGLSGFLALAAVNRTIKASIYAAGLVTGRAFDEARKAGLL